jgi:NCAIR mutase (PurE)-related protein
VEELVILEMVEYDLRELAETCALLMDSGRPTILNWAEGVAFFHQALPFNTKELLKERKQGRIYWASVIYAGMPQYVPGLKVGARDIPVLATPNPLLVQVAAWLKQRLQKG